MKSFHQIALYTDECMSLQDQVLTIARYLVPSEGFKIAVKSRNVSPHPREQARGEQKPGQDPPYLLRFWLRASPVFFVPRGQISKSKKAA